MNIHDLSTSERILLAQQLWDSVRNNASAIELTPEQQQILDSRLAALEKDGDLADAWLDVKSRILKG